MIPAGLFGNSIEFFVYEDELYALYLGSKYHWKDLPESILNRMDEIYNKAPKRHLIKQMNLPTLMDEVIQYFSCMYGGLDSDGDINLDDDVSGAIEYWPCTKRGTCAFEGKICHFPGGLSKREIDVVKAMALDLSMQQIADKLFIAHGTLISHKTSIFTKLKVNKNTAVVSWAAKHNII